MKKIGIRVGAIRDSTDKVVNLYGYGVYEGDEVPDENAGGLGQLCRELGRTNPKIRLDSGLVVWGCECWWGPEDEIKRKIGDREVRIVTRRDR